jgi:Sulfotransferase domain
MPHQVWTAKPKIIHISREVKDVACSLYHFRTDVKHDRVSSIDNHFDEFLQDKVLYGPYREHLLNWQNLPDYENIIYLTYEEVVADKRAVLKKLAGFLGKSMSDEQMAKAEEYLSFEKMKSKILIDQFNP